jgi:hypothetical protein
VTRGWRKLHNEELHNLYSSPSIIRIVKIKDDVIGRACSTNGVKINAFRILAEKPEGKRQLERPRRRWVDTIKMDLRGMGWGGMEWIDLTKDRDQWRLL